MINIIIGAPRSGTTFLWTLLENYRNVMPLTIDTLNETEKPASYTTSESGVFIRKQYTAVDNFIKNNKDKILIEKTPVHTLVYDSIPKKYLSNTILLYRNPIDIAASMYLSITPEVFKSYDIRRSLNETKAYYKKLQEIKASANIIVKYEALVEDIKNLDPILDLLNIKDYEYKFKEQISIAKRRNNKTLTDKEFELFKNNLAEEIDIWENI